MSSPVSGKRCGPCCFESPGPANSSDAGNLERLDFDELVSRYAQIARNDATFSFRKFNATNFVPRIIQFAEQFSMETEDGHANGKYDRRVRRLNETYREVVSPMSSASTMEDVVDIAREMTHLDEYADELESLKRALKVTEDLIQRAEELEQELDRITWTDLDTSIPAGVIDFDDGGIFDIEPEIALRASLREAVANIEGLKQAAVHDFQVLLADAVRSVGPDENGEFSIPHTLSSLVAREMEGVGEGRGAIAFYNMATRKAARERRITQSMAYRLEALRVTAAEEPERVEKEILPEVAKISGYAPVMLASVIGDGGEENNSSEEFRTVFGTPEDVVKLSINALRTEYVAVLGHLSQPDIGSGERTEYTVKQMELEDKLRDEAEAFIGGATPDQVEAFLFAFQYQVDIWTQKNGIIEEKLRTGEAGEAEEYYEHLKKTLDIYRRLAKPYLKPGNPIYEKMATLSWQVHFDGQRSLDAPFDGLQDLSEEVIPEFSESLSIAAHRRELCEEASAAGIAGELFDDDGEINPDIDISELPAGISAGDRTRSVYMEPNSLGRSLGLPIAGGAVGYGIGLAASASNPVSFLLAVGGTGLAIGGNYLYDTRVRGANAYAQAVRTGLSRVSEKEAWGYRKSFSMNVAWMSATAGIAPGPGGVLKSVWDIGRAGVHSLRTLPGLVASGIRAGGFAGRTLRGFAGAGRGFMTAAGSVGQRIAGMSGPARFGLGAASVGASAMLADWGFIAHDYDFDFGDGKVDTLVGNAGKAILWGELIYRGFRFTWRTGTRTMLMKDGAMCDARTASAEFASGAESRTYTGFGSSVEKDWRQWRARVTHAGAYGMTADYNVVNMDGDGNLEFLDFDAPRDTLAQRLADDEQQTIDTPLGYIGGAAFAAPWAFSEFQNFPMFINDASRVRFARIRTLAGLGGIALDGGVHTWYLGGLGGSLLANEAVASALGVDAAASLASTGVRVIWEWQNQYVQNQPLQAPDAWRLVMASTESNVMRAPIKAFMRGRASLSQFPAGQRLVQLHEGMERSPFALVRGLSRIRSLQGLASETRLMPGSGAFKEVRARTAPSVIISLPRDTNGETLKQPAEMRILDNRGRGARFVLNGVEYRIRTGQSNTRTNGVSDKIVRVSDGQEVQNEIGPLLKQNNFYIRSGVLWRMQEQSLGQVRLPSPTRQTVTPEALEAMEESKRQAILQRLGREEQVFYDSARKQFYQLRMVSPENPQVISAHGKYTGGAVSSDTEKIMAIRGGGGEIIWIRIPRERVYFGEAELGGVRATLYTGNRNSPRPGPLGVLYNVAVIPTSAAALSSAVFAGTMSGDPEYQPAMRWLHYLACEAVVHPKIMWPLGFDTWQAQLVGRGVLTPIIVAEAKIFPSYRDSWPGVKLHNRRLLGLRDDQTGNPFVDRVVTVAGGVSSALRFWEWGNDVDRDSAFAVFANDMFSTQINPFGEAGFMQPLAEPPAIRTYLREEDCMRDVMVGGSSIDGSAACGQLHPRTKKALKQELPSYTEVARQRGLDMVGLQRERVAADAREMRGLVEYERRGIMEPEAPRLGTLHRRALVLKAAMAVERLREARGSGSSLMLDIMRPYEELQRDVPSLFGDELYPPLDAPGKVDDFVNALNGGDVPALSFSSGLDTSGE